MVLEIYFSVISITKKIEKKEDQERREIRQAIPSVLQKNNGMKKEMEKRGNEMTNAIANMLKYKPTSQHDMINNVLA